MADLNSRSQADPKRNLASSIGTGLTSIPASDPQSLAEQVQAAEWLSQSAQQKYGLSPQEANKLAALVLTVL